MSGTGPRRLDQTLRAVGAVTRALHDCRVGDVIGVRGPFGAGWHLPVADGRDLLLVAGGIGLAPLRPALVAALADRFHYRDVTLVVGARTPADLLFTGAVDGWVSAGARVETTVDRAADGWTGRVGLAPAVLEDLTIDPANTTALICGPEVMMRFTAAALLRRGVPAADVQVSLERNMRCGVAWCGHCQLGPLLLCRDRPVVEQQVPCSTGLHARLAGRPGRYLTGPAARYTLSHRWLSPLARQAAAEAGLGPDCRNPFRSIVVRAVETVYAVEEALRLVERYEPPRRPAVPVPARAGIGHGATDVELVTCDGEPTALIDAWTGARLAVVVDAVRRRNGVVGERLPVRRRASCRHPYRRRRVTRRGPRRHGGPRPDARPHARPAARLHRPGRRRVVRDRTVTGGRGSCGPAGRGDRHRRHDVAGALMYLAVDHLPAQFADHAVDGGRRVEFGLTARPSTLGGAS